MFNELHSHLFNFEMSDRYDWLTGEPVSNGRIFLNNVSDCENLSDVEILHKGVDTLKARFHGTIKRSLANRIYQTLEGSFDPVFTLDKTDFILSPSSKASRYKFKLHNKALGVLIFIGDYFANEETWLEEGKGKIKFELSPHFILESGLENVVYAVNHFVRSIMSSYEPAGVDTHICVDLQGWQPDPSIINDMVTMARTKSSYNGIDHFETDLANSAVRYGDNESFTFGRANSSQLAIYDKSKESEFKGTASFWRSLYESNNIAYHSLKKVFRVELRLPATVIKNLVKKSDGSPYQILSIEQLLDHLNSLWVYGLSRLFRYDYNTAKTKTKTIRPIWQMLLEDVYFNDILMPADYKRDYVTTDDSIDTNIKLAMGNLTTAFAKASVSDDDAIAMIKEMPIYRQLLEYAKESKGLSEDNYLAHILDVLHKKRIEFDKRAANSSLNFALYRRNYKYSSTPLS